MGHRRCAGMRTREPCVCRWRVRPVTRGLASRNRVGPSANRVPLDAIRGNPGPRIRDRGLALPHPRGTTWPSSRISTRTRRCQTPSPCGASSTNRRGADAKPCAPAVSGLARCPVCRTPGPGAWQPRQRPGGGRSTPPGTPRPVQVDGRPPVATAARPCGRRASDSVHRICGQLCGSNPASGRQAAPTLGVKRCAAELGSCGANFSAAEMRPRKRHLCMLFPSVSLDNDARPRSTRDACLVDRDRPLKRWTDPSPPPAPRATRPATRRGWPAAAPGAR